MRSVVQRKSYGSVTVFWLDKDEALRRVRESARRLILEKPEVIAVYLFGSLATGKAVPGSDADVMIIIDESNQRWIDRSTEYRDYFDNTGLPVDIFCYTPEESQRNRIARNAVEKGVLMADRSSEHQ